MPHRSPMQKRPPCPSGATFKMLGVHTDCSYPRDVSEGFDDAVVLLIDDARSPALDMMTVSHSALAALIR